ncbi:MAG TPA: hypothetical protein VE617_13690 [Propionibacteriaceae bacterium]|nr:hypothetical protein [Propionibacteriaceae bacterium]
MSTSTPSTAWVKAGLAALPLYGVLVGYATLKAQPDQTVDPDAWARFVASPSYLAEHIASNVLGPVIAIFGTLALGALLVSSRAPRLALSGTVLAVTGHILFMVPGTISTFGTPPIGAAYLDGHREVMALEFSPVLGLITAVALLLTVVGNTLLGLAIWRSGALPKWTGGLWIAATWIFYVLGAALGMATTGAALPTQPVGAVLMTISSAGIAWAVLRHRSGEPTADEPLVLSGEARHRS